MCTLSWHRAHTGYTVLFNRDERRTRPIATAPGVRYVHGVRALCPLDPEGGGTWLGANEFGMTVALANRYGIVTPAPRVSRGLLVLGLLAVTDLGELRARLGATDLRTYAGFTLVGFAPGMPPWQLAWDGEQRTEITVAHQGLVVTSSAADGMGVAASRGTAFAGVTNLDTLRRLHAGHAPARGSRSVCMHRADAETVSFSEVAVTPEHVTFRYQPGAPCAGTAPQAERLTRRVRAA